MEKLAAQLNRANGLLKESADSIRQLQNENEQLMAKVAELNRRIDAEDLVQDMIDQGHVHPADRKDMIQKLLTQEDINVVKKAMEYRRQEGFGKLAGDASHLDARDEYEAWLLGSY